MSSTENGQLTHRSHGRGEGMGVSLLELDRKDQIKVERPVYTQIKFDEGYEHTKPKSKSAKEYACDIVKEHFTCSKKCLKSFVLRTFPFIKIMQHYVFPQWLISDLISGLTVGIMHLPQGMAYALLAGLPSIHGLYVSFFPPIIYFFFGSSKHISIGTMAVVSLMVGSVVDQQLGKLTLLPSAGSSTNDTELILPVTNVTIINDTTSYDIPSNSTTKTTSPVGQSDICDVDNIVDVACVNYKIGVATALTLLVGLWQFLQGVLKLGFLINYLSDPLISGFTTGAACHVFTSQIKHVFGLKIKSSKYSNPFKLPKLYYDFFRMLPETNLAALILSAVCILILVLVKECVNARPKIRKKIKMPVPVELIVVILGTIVSYFAKMTENYELTVVGEIPTGIPAPRLPPSEHLGSLIVDAFSIAVVAFTISVSMAKILAKKHNYTVDPNQELIAYGVCNLVGSCFTAYSCCASMSRSLVQDTTGGNTQIAGLISSCFILIVILAAGPLFKALPRCILASIIIVALKGMFLQVKELKRLWHISKFDLAIWIVTFLGVVLIGVDMGLLIGVGFSLVSVVFRTQWPYTCVYGRIPHTDIYRDKSVYQMADEIPGVTVFHFESSLYYANAEHFRNRLYELTGVNPVLEKVAIEKRKAEKAKNQKNGKNGNSKNAETEDDVNVEMGSTEDDHFVISSSTATILHHIVIDCSAMTYLDAVGVKVLKSVVGEYNSIGVKIYLAHCRGNFVDMLHNTDALGEDTSDTVFLTVHDAVLAALEAHHNKDMADELRHDNVVSGGISKQSASEVSQKPDSQNSGVKDQGNANDDVE